MLSIKPPVLGQESFQMIRFDQRGEARLWAQDMMASWKKAMAMARCLLGV